MSPVPSDEVERITRVYHGYAQTSGIRQRWDAANRGNQANLRQRKQETVGLLSDAGLLPLRGRKVLDVGCGGGAELAALRDYGADPDDLQGIDLLHDRVASARARFPDLRFEVGNAERLPFADGTCDLVLAFTLFSSILDATMAANVAAEIARVLKPGGAVLWYDFRYDSPRNPNVRGVTRRQIASAFPGFAIRLRRITLVPPLARRLGSVTPLLFPVLSAIPLLRTHYLGLLTKPVTHA